MIIDGDCISGCTQLLNINYLFNVYQSWSLDPTNNQEIWFYYQNDSQILGNLYNISYKFKNLEFNLKDMIFYRKKFKRNNYL